MNQFISSAAVLRYRITYTDADLAEFGTALLADTSCQRLSAALAALPAELIALLDVLALQQFFDKWVIQHSWRRSHAQPTLKAFFCG